MEEIMGTLIELLKARKENEVLLSLEHYVLQNPSKIYAKVTYAMFLQEVPFADDETALKVLDEIYLQDDLYIPAIILRVHIEYIHRGFIEELTLEKLNSCIEKGDKSSEYYSLLFIMKALCYRLNKEEGYKKVLLDSIQANKEASSPYRWLGDYYKGIGDSSEAKACYKKALERVTHVYAREEFVNFADFREFIKEHITATSSSSSNYQSLTHKVQKM